LQLVRKFCNQKNLLKHVLISRESENLSLNQQPKDKEIDKNNEMMGTLSYLDKKKLVENVVNVSVLPAQLLE
jgi:hypothetical protein